MRADRFRALGGSGQAFDDGFDIALRHGVDFVQSAEALFNGVLEGLVTGLRHLFDSGLDRFGSDVIHVTNS